MNQAEERMRLPKGYRYHCFHRDIETSRACALKATWYWMDSSRADAMTFYCGEHAPIGAKPIGQLSPYLAIELATILTLGASTIANADAGHSARNLVESLLEPAGIRVCIIGSTAGLMAPAIPIIGQSNDERD